MKKSLRFNSIFVPREDYGVNLQFMGLYEMVAFVYDHFRGNPNLRMLEIGAYMGDSTFIWAASGIFKDIYTIDPHCGEEEANDILGVDWKDVKRNYNTNTRFFNNITLIPDYSYNVVDKFKDGTVDFIYIDANHSYEGVKKDIELFLPKLSKGGIIGGHDYNKEWSGVIKAVDEIFGKPDATFWDNSWFKVIDK